MSQHTETQALAPAIEITQEEYRQNIQKYLELSRNGKQVQVMNQEQILMILGRGKKVFRDFDEEENSWLD